METPFLISAAEPVIPVLAITGIGRRELQYIISYYITENLGVKTVVVSIRNSWPVQSIRSFSQICRRLGRRIYGEVELDFFVSVARALVPLYVQLMPRNLQFEH